MDYINENNEMKWDIDVSILTNRFIFKELAKAMSISIFITITIVILIMLPEIRSGNFHTNASVYNDTKYALTLIGLVFVLTILFIFVYYGNRYMLSYHLDSKGISTKNQEQQSRKNNKISYLLILAGLLARNPTTAGIGFLSGSYQDQNISWRSIRKATFYPENNTVVLSSAYGSKCIVFCNSKNYENVSAFIRSMCNDRCYIKEK